MLEIARQAWPVLVASWASVAFGVIDTAMGGHAGAIDLQIMALATSIYITIFVGLMGVVHALIPILAQHYGAGRQREVGRMWGQGVWLAIGLCGVGAAFLLVPDLWLNISGDIEPQVRAGVKRYLHALILALPDPILCRPDCAGLCPVCGEPLAGSDPDAHRHESGGDPRWAKLDQIKFGPD